MQALYRILFLFSVSSSSLMAMDLKIKDEFLNHPETMVTIDHITQENTEITTLYKGWLKGAQEGIEKACLVQGVEEEKGWVLDDEKKSAQKKLRIHFPLQNQTLSKEYVDLTEIPYTSLGIKEGREQHVKPENMATVYAMETFKRPDDTQLLVRKDLYRLQEVVEWEKTSSSYKKCTQECWEYMGFWAKNKKHYNVTFSQTQGKRLIYRLPLETEVGKELIKTVSFLDTKRLNGGWAYHCAGR